MKVSLLDRLEKVKTHIMAVDGWSQADVEAIDEALDILRYMWGLK